MRHLPCFGRSRVVQRFGQTSKELGIPTANFAEQVVDNLPADVAPDIYYGWASAGSGDVHKLVVSIGWNPILQEYKEVHGNSHRAHLQTELLWGNPQCGHGWLPQTRKELRFFRVTYFSNLRRY